MWRALSACLALACQPRGQLGTEGTSPPDPLPLPPSETTSPKTSDVSGCLVGPGAAGPWDAHPIAVAGAKVTREPYTFDAGIGDVLAAAEGQVGEATIEIAVSGAVVTSLDYVPSDNDGTGTFWLEDGGGAMRAYRVDTGSVDPADLRPGDQIGFTATAVQDFFGTPEITDLTDLVVEGQTAVHVVDGNTGTPLDYAVDGQRTVEVWGGLSAGPTDCTAACYEMEYPGGTITFRTDSTFVRVGDCIHFIGPLGQFEGDEQLDTSNFDWYAEF